jgi:hypothetical protein
MKMENEEPAAGHTSETNKKKSGWKEFLSLGEVGGYFFRKKDPSRPSNINLRMMHGVNRISILIFLVGVLYLIFKLVIKPNLN